MLSHSFKLKNKLCNAFAAISITLVGIKIHLFVIFKVVTQKRPQIHRPQGNIKYQTRGMRYTAFTHAASKGLPKNWW